MKYTTKQIWDQLLERVNDTYDIFKAFFGEAYVDLQREGLPYTYENQKDNISKYIANTGVAKVVGEDEVYGLIYDLSEEALEEVEEHYANSKYNIFVWWDKVTVTNENDKSITIQDLYAKVPITMNGTIPFESIGFRLNRATYPEIQFRSDYMHSHIQNIPKSAFSTFMQPCLGRGPIIQTIMTLKNDYDEAMWMLFCEELSRYVTVESLEGVPWKKLESVGARVSDTTYYAHMIWKRPDILCSNSCHVTILREHLKDFIKYYLENGHLSISYQYGYYTMGTPYFDYIIDISNAFINFYNSYLNTFFPDPHTLFERGLIKERIIDNGKFYASAYNSDFYSGILDIYQDKYVLTFKGKRICTKILPQEKNEDDDVHTSIILDNEFAVYILSKILHVINYRYGKQKDSASHARAIYL